MRRKKSQTVVKDTEPKDQAKGSTKGGKKKLLRSPHMIHLSLNGILQYSTIIISKNYQNEVKWRQIENIKYTLIRR
jgi:hypothetical protein